jgi:hypothetical protein
MKDHHPASPLVRQQPSQNELDEHLMFLPDTDWAVWKWTGLRGTGFPISQVLQLAMPTYAAAVDRFLSCEGEVEELRGQICVLLLEEMKHAPEEQRGLLFKMRQQIKHKKKLVASPQPLSSEVQTCLDALQAAETRSAQAYSQLSAYCSQATEQTMQVLAEIARSERFREAVLWQNRRAVQGSIDSFLSKPIVAHPGHELRKQSQVIAKYVQRYCTKNDTIGFFGPLGWGCWVNDGSALVLQPRQPFLAARSVYFETWAIDALGETLAEKRELLPWARPRMLPFLHLSGVRLGVPFGRPQQLSAATARVLGACDGQRTARELAWVVLQESVAGLTSEADVFAILEQLREARRITWTFEVSIEEWHPERALRRQLEQITSDTLRQEALCMLDQLDASRVGVAEATGNVERLDRALEQLDRTFTDLTGMTATREAGKTYAARTLVYEDCRRNGELTLGPALLEELGRPLGLLLASARWFTYEGARLYLQAFREVYRTLAAKAGSVTVDFATFWSWIQPLVPAEQGSQRLIYKLEPEFQKRWAEVLQIPPGQRSIHYTSEALQGRVQEIFHAPGAGWPSAIYHSPDVMINATDPEAIRRGAYQFVLGEFHQGLNTLDNLALAAQHPQFADLLQAIGGDQPEPRVIPVFPRHAVAGKRLHPAFIRPTDWRLLFGVDSAGVSTDVALPIGQLVLEEVEDNLIVRRRDGSNRFDLLALLDGVVSLQACDSFKILAPAGHTPRISIDRLVISRETWRFQPGELSWALTTDQLESFVGVRRWAHAHGIPRHFFVRTPNEKKPYYVDLASPVFTEIFAKAVRQAREASDAVEASISVSEMLPDPEHSWLLDSEGQQYTSELRLVAVDQVKPVSGSYPAGVLSEEATQE